MSSMIWARSWPFGESMSTWTPDLEIWCLSSMTSCRSREAWGENIQGLWSVSERPVDSRSHGSSWGKRAPPSQLRSRSRCSSCSCWCRQWLSSAQRCRPPQTDGSPSRCQTYFSAESAKHVTTSQSWCIPPCKATPAWASICLFFSENQHISKTKNKYKQHTSL